MPRIRTDSPARRALAAFPLAALLCALFVLLGFPAHAGAAAPDTLGVQVVAVERDAHAFLQDAIADRSLDAELLYDKISQAAGGVLVGVEGSCRTNLMPKYSEPGSPWLGWRLLARVRRDSCEWFIGALSCADSLCGGTLVTHERLAFLSVTPARSRILIYPGRPSTIGDDGTTQIDSVALFKGSSHILVQARRRADSQHPCFDGPHHSSVEAADFFVLRGDRVLQAFSLDVAAESADHDDESGDSGTNMTGTLVASATNIQLDRRTDAWQESPDGNPQKTQHKVQEARVRLRFSDGSGTYLTSHSER